MIEIKRRLSYWEDVLKRHESCGDGHNAKIVKIIIEELELILESIGE